jgi:hypothetical protein
VVSQALTLPSDVTPLATAQGEHRLLSSHNSQDFWRLNDYFVTQKTLTYCGIASSVMVLNALHVKRPVDPVLYPYSLFTQTNIFDKPGLKFTTPTTTGFDGNDVDQIAGLLKSYDLDVHAYHANKSSYKQFKHDAIHALSKANCYVIINFDRKTLKEHGGGHFSPLGAYDKKTNSFLVMDVSRYKYPMYWVKAPLLWKSIDTLSLIPGSKAKKYRGYIIVCNSPHAAV